MDREEKAVVEKLTEGTVIVISYPKENALTWHECVRALLAISGKRVLITSVVDRPGRTGPDAYAGTREYTVRLVDKRGRLRGSEVRFSLDTGYYEVKPMWIKVVGRMQKRWSPVCAPGAPTQHAPAFSVVCGGCLTARSSSATSRRVALSMCRGRSPTPAAPTSPAAPPERLRALSRPRRRPQGVFTPPLGGGLGNRSERWSGKHS